MKRIYLLAVFILNIIIVNTFGQGTTCAASDPFCTGTVFEFPACINSGVAEIGPDYGCLDSTNNPAWFYLLIDQPGNIDLDIHSSNGENVDFICWGPFISFSNSCNNLTSTNIIDCGNNMTNPEYCNIPNAQTGNYYILFLTNNANPATHIIFSQINAGQIGAGNTNCSTCACYFDNITYTIQPCNPVTNLYSVTGTIIFQFYSTPLTTGILTITDNISGDTLSFPAPFTSPQPFTFLNIPSDGLQHSLTTTFTAAPENIYTVTYTAPDTCNISSVDQNNENEIFNIFPNPITNNTFEIKYTSKVFDNILIKIVNNQGIEVFRKFIAKKTESIEIQLDTSGLINGYYLVEINNGQKIIRKSVVIQNIYNK